MLLTELQIVTTRWLEVQFPLRGAQVPAFYQRGHFALQFGYLGFLGICEETLSL